MNDTTTLLSMLKLKLNIEHPSVEESYVYGFEAAKAGVAEEENPYAVLTKESEYWADGWWAGFYGQTPLFTLAESDAFPSMNQLTEAANDRAYKDSKGGFFVKMLEITSVIGVAALVGYQVLELVA